MNLIEKNFNFSFIHDVLELLNDFFADFYEAHDKYYFS